jgi:hypothetical protein
MSSRVDVSVCNNNTQHACNDFFHIISNKKDETDSLTNKLKILRAMCDSASSLTEAFGKHLNFAHYDGNISD